jgi:hypothetical protein
MARLRQFGRGLFVAMMWAAPLSSMQAASPSICDTLSADHIELPTAFNDDGWLYLRASLDGAPERWFLLDTGTTPSVVNMDYARLAKLNLTGGKGRGAGAGDNRPAFIRTSAKVRAGTFTTAAISIVALDLPKTGPDGQPVGGVLGTSFLKGQVLVVDYRIRKAWISQGSLAGCQTAQPFKLRYGIVVTSIKVGGRTKDAVVDSGGVFELLVQPSAAPALGLSEVMEKSKLGDGYGYGGKVDIRVAAGPSLDVGQIHRPESQISFITIPLKIDVAIGTHFLRQTRTTIDYRTRKILFEE